MECCWRTHLPQVHVCVHWLAEHRQRADAQALRGRCVLQGMHVGARQPVQQARCQRRKACAYHPRKASMELLPAWEPA